MRRRQQAFISLILAGVLCAGNISSAVYAGETGVLETTSLSPEEILVGVESGEPLPVISDSAATGIDSSESSVSENPLSAPEEEETTNVESLDETRYDVWNDEVVPVVEMTEETEDSYVMEDLIADEGSEEEEEVYDNFMEEELSAAEESSGEEIIAEGVCGTNVKWKLDENGTLTIYSESDTPQPMSDYKGSDSPFCKEPLYYKIKTVIIGQNISRIGANAFSRCRSLFSVEIQGNLSEIDETAFNDCNAITTIIISENNKHFILEDAVLYNNERTRLIMCMRGKESVIIPDTVEKIDSQAFRGCSKLKDITISSSIKELGSKIFSDCSSLTSIVIPDNIRRIGSYAFSGCSSLTSVVIPDSVNELGEGAFSGCNNIKNATISSSIKELESETFSGCSSLTSIVIPDNIRRIGEYAFFGCSSLKTIILPGSVSEIDAHAFEKSGLESITIPEGITEIKYGTFAECKSLSTVFLPDNIVKIGTSAFQKAGLKSIMIPDSVNELDAWAFADCKELEYIYIPHSVSVISVRLLSGCHSLTEVFIPDTVNQIGNYAFSDCSSLKGVFIPQSVNKIGKEVFSKYSEPVLYGYQGSYAHIYARTNDLAFNRVFFNGTVTFDEHLNEWIDINTGRSWKHENETDAWYYSDPSENEWISASSIAEDESDYAVVFLSFTNELSELLITEENTITNSDEDPTQGGADGTCGKCGLNVMWTLDEQGVLTIDGAGDTFDYGSLGNTGTSPFCGSKLIKTVIVGEQVTSIGSYMFNRCENLKSISISDQVIKIGAGAFYDCESLESISVPSGVNAICEETFYNCKSLKQVSYSGDISYIDHFAFYLCTGLESIPEIKGVKSIGQQAFAHCSGLKEILIPEGVRVIWNGAFHTCYNAHRVVIPNSVSKIYPGSFDGLFQLESFNVAPDNMYYKSSDGILYNKSGEDLITCPPLKTYASILKETRRIRDGAFERCNIKGISLNNSITSIGKGAFASCLKLESITLPNSVTYLGEEAFSNCCNLVRVSLPSEIKQIYAGLFSKCCSLTKIDIPSTVLYIGNNSFNGCSSLAEVILPSGLKSMGMSAFQGCRNLSCIMVPEGITAIPEQAFDGCWNLGEVWIPDSLTSIGNNAFRDCYDIKIIRYSDQDFSESSPEYEERFGIDIHNDENGGLVDDQGNKYCFDEEATELYRLDESGGKTPVREYYRQKLIEEGFTANEINDFFAADIIEYHRAAGDGEEDILSAAALSDLSVRGRYAFFVRKKRYLSAIANKEKRAQTALNKSTKISSRPTVKISYRGTIYMTAGRKLRAPRVYGLKKGDSVSKWISSRKTVVRVNSKTGLLTAKRKGTAAITVITRYGARKSFVVRVMKPTVRFSKKKVTLRAGGSTLVSVRMVSGDKISSVRSSKKKVVRVVRLGKSIYLIAGKKGRAKITVRTKFGGKKTMKVVVKEAKK